MLTFVNGQISLSTTGLVISTLCLHKFPVKNVSYKYKKGNLGCNILDVASHEPIRPNVGAHRASPTILRKKEETLLTKYFKGCFIKRENKVNAKPVREALWDRCAGTKEGCGKRRA